MFHTLTAPSRQDLYNSANTKDHDLLTVVFRVGATYFPGLEISDAPPVAEEAS
ncbi:MAG: hypothetical protein J5482_04880 [Oscillospiraceae bacterium]|nr:hypothetical protein [Oscillospiraceae bacterium]